MKRELVIVFRDKQAQEFEVPYLIEDSDVLDIELQHFVKSPNVSAVWLELDGTRVSLKEILDKYEGL